MANQEEVVQAPDLQEVARVLRGHYGRGITAGRLRSQGQQVQEILRTAGIDLPAHGDAYELVKASLTLPPKERPKNAPAENSTAAMVLRTAHRTPSPFTFEMLCIACYEAHPSDFCLKNHIDYLDSRKVSTVLFGARGLVQRGFLVKLPNGLYTVPKKADAPLAPCING